MEAVDDMDGHGARQDLSQEAENLAEHVLVTAK